MAQYYLQEAIHGYTGSNNSSSISGEGYSSKVQFEKIYKFLGGLFDPNMSNHDEEYEELTTTDQEVVKILMDNLAINLMGNNSSSSSSSTTTATTVNHQTNSATNAIITNNNNLNTTTNNNQVLSNGISPLATNNGIKLEFMQTNTTISFNNDDVLSPSTLKSYKMSPRVLGGANMLQSLASDINNQ